MKNDWKERFRKQFVDSDGDFNYFIDSEGVESNAVEPIESFIQSEIDKAKKEAVKEFVEKIKSKQYLPEYDMGIKYILKIIDKLLKEMEETK